MYSPTYSITHNILNYVVKYEVAIEKINSKRLPEDFFNGLYEKLHAEDIDKLGELVGHSIGYSKALEAQRGKLLPSSRSKFKLYVNYRSINDFIDGYTASQFIKPSIELGIHINKLLMKGLIDQWQVGKLRGASEKPEEIYDTWYKQRDFYPNIEFKEYFDDVFEWINKPPVRIHKLIQLAILLYELIDKAPFYSGNQITSVIMIAAIAKEYGYNPKNIMPFIKAVEFLGDDLLSAHRMAKSSRDLTVFIEAFLYTISLTALGIENQVEDLYTNKAGKHKELKKKFNDRQLKILEYLEVEGKVTRQKYTKMMGVSFMTSFRDLEELLEQGYIKRKGKARGTHYVLPSKKSQKQETEREKLVFGGH